MRSFGLAALFVLALIVANVLSDCPEGGCKCGEHCVNRGNKWCNSDNDADCSCKKGCLVFDTLLKNGETEWVYCNKCECEETGRVTPRHIALVDQRTDRGMGSNLHSVCVGSLYNYGIGHKPCSKTRKGWCPEDLQENVHYPSNWADLGDCAEQ